jgi:SAM-dependent methyltransferase
MFVPLKIDCDASPIEPLFDPLVLGDWEARLRAQLVSDDDYATDRDLDAFKRMQIYGTWFQRVPIPGTRITTTSDHSKAVMLDGNPLQTLYGRLTEREGSILRPYAKWCFIEPKLPDLSGKTVLDAGCNCGFFAFEFSRLGAVRVTGCEVDPATASMASHIASEMPGRGAAVTIVCDDFTKSSAMLAHDVMFLGEVLTHSPCPVSTLYSAALLTNETLIIDDFFERQDGPLDFYIATAGGDGWAGTKAGQFVFLAASVPEHLMLKTLRIAGVLPCNVRRLRDPIEARHTLIIADMRGARERRQHELWNPYLRSMIGAERARR